MVVVAMNASHCDLTLCTNSSAMGLNSAGSDERCVVNCAGSDERCVEVRVVPIEWTLCVQSNVAGWWRITFV